MAKVWPPPAGEQYGQRDYSRFQETPTRTLSSARSKAPSEASALGEPSRVGSPKPKKSRQSPPQTSEHSIHNQTQIRLAEAASKHNQAHSRGVGMAQGITPMTQNAIEEGRKPSGFRQWLFGRKAKSSPPSSASELQPQRPQPMADSTNTGVTVCGALIEERVEVVTTTLTRRRVLVGVAENK
jgi:hypothetical protein